MSAQPLPPILDTTAALPLRDALLACIDLDNSIHYDGTEVVRIGQACLQVLVSARATAVARGLGFRIDGISDPMARMIQLARLEDLLDPVTLPA